jgi:peptidoglycan/LPS O-acetylase OafA/YrhL
MNTSKIRLEADDSKDGRDFEKLVLWVSSLSIAVMAAFLTSLKQVNPAIQLRFTVGSVVAFALGGILTAVFLRMILKADKRKRTFLVVGAMVVCVLGYFLMGIEKTSSENRSDVTIGTAIAVAVLSCVALVLWRVIIISKRIQPTNATMFLEN